MPLLRRKTNFDAKAQPSSLQDFNVPAELETTSTMEGSKSNATAIKAMEKEDLDSSTKAPISPLDPIGSIPSTSPSKASTFLFPSSTTKPYSDIKLTTSNLLAPPIDAVKSDAAECLKLVESGAMSPTDNTQNSASKALESGTVDHPSFLASTLAGLEPRISDIPTSPLSPALMAPTTITKSALGARLKENGAEEEGEKEKEEVVEVVKERNMDAKTRKSIIVVDKCPCCGKVRSSSSSSLNNPVHSLSLPPSPSPSPSPSPPPAPPPPPPPPPPHALSHPIAIILGGAATFVAAVGGSAGVMTTYFELSRAHEMEVYLSGRELATVVRNAVKSCVAGTLAGIAFGSIGACACIGRAIFKPVAAAVVVHHLASQFCQWKSQIEQLVKDLESPSPSWRLRALMELIDLVRRHPSVVRPLFRLSIIPTLVHLLVTCASGSPDFSSVLDLIFELIKDFQCRTSFFSLDGITKALENIDDTPSNPFLDSDLKILKLVSAAATYPEGQDSLRQSAHAEKMVNLLRKGAVRLNSPIVSPGAVVAAAITTADIATPTAIDFSEPSASSSFSLPSAAILSTSAASEFQKFLPGSSRLSPSKSPSTDSVAGSEIPRFGISATPMTFRHAPKPSSSSAARRSDTDSTSGTTIISNNGLRQIEKDAVRECVNIVHLLSLDSDCRTHLVRADAMAALVGLLRSAGHALQDKLTIVTALHHLARAPAMESAVQGRASASAAKVEAAADVMLKVMREGIEELEEREGEEEGEKEKEEEKKEEEKGKDIIDEEEAKGENNARVVKGMSKKMERGDKQSIRGSGSSHAHSSSIGNKVTINSSNSKGEVVLDLKSKPKTLSPISPAIRESLSISPDHTSTTSDGGGKDEEPTAENISGAITESDINKQDAVVHPNPVTSEYDDPSMSDIQRLSKKIESDIIQMSQLGQVARPLLALSHRNMTSDLNAAKDYMRNSLSNSAGHDDGHVAIQPFISANADSVMSSTDAASMVTNHTSSGENTPSKSIFPLGINILTVNKDKTQKKNEDDLSVVVENQKDLSVKGQNDAERSDSDSPMHVMDEFIVVRGNKLL